MLSFLRFYFGETVGTPGVGKSTLCQQLAERLNFEWVDVGKLAKDNDFYESFDSVLECPILHEDKVRFFISYSVKPWHKFCSCCNQICKSMSNLYRWTKSSLVFQFQVVLEPSVPSFAHAASKFVNQF